MTRYLILALALAVLAGLFALQNSVPVTVTFLAWQIEGSLAQVLLAAFVFGVITGLLIWMSVAVKKRRGASGVGKQ